MRVEIFCSCDYAATDDRQKLTIVGEFDTIFAKTTPMIQPLLCIAAKIRFDKGDEGPKAMAITIFGPNGEPIVGPMTSKITVRFEEETASAQFALHALQTKLPNFGEYSIALEIDNKIEASRPLYVKQISIPTAPSSP